MEEELVGPTKKRPGQVSGTGDFNLKKPRPPPPETLSGNEEEEDESVLELKKLLETGAEMVPFKVMFAPYPYTWHPIYDSCSSYITINVGHEESCGSSFSDSDSSVMASVDLSSLNLSSPEYGFGTVTGDGSISSPEHGFGPATGGRRRKCDAQDWDDFDDALATFVGEEDY